MTEDTFDILFVEDDPEFSSGYVRWFEKHGHSVEHATTGQEAVRRCDQREFDIIVLDWNLPGLSGLELVQRMCEENPDTEIIVLTGEGTIEKAVESMRRGVFDFLSKPFSMSGLERRCKAALERRRLKMENARLREVIDRGRTPDRKMIGESKPMKSLYRLIDRVAPTDKAVLIQGESGTGKELVAQAIHAGSPRAQRPLVTINCAALPEQLVESELFGHEKGAFTGATAAKPGLFEIADESTLFIDEIGELPLSLQPKLLRVLEDGSLRRVGSHKQRRVNVRIVAATNRDLQQEVAEHRFREDLFYRINVMPLNLPPLRQRTGDIELLIDHFLGNDWEIEADARAALLNCQWPGNIRQLINTIDRAQILADDGVITIEDLPAEMTSRKKSVVSEKAPADSSIYAVMRAHLIDVLRREQGNKTQAAQILGVDRRKLYRMLLQYDIGE
ncbi:Transcriptional regulatory protein ZraR [Rosistilla oblonga]|uniref:sigma-54-dependent transcriptional regulator n=1 Tax=Rosistilla oblonga TaxID=2527990 RepID=UPI00118B84E1|nr:sigma-54 dependent transcriptional regulator [Rosistilla oblonga]QDV13085.1 Transcriptional regulatory protein ZraR [Rosistilla oblonga]